MPLFAEKNTLPTNQTNDSGSETLNKNNQTQPKPKEESGLIKTIGQLLPLAPFVYEQFTGQKVPPMSGTMAEMHMALINIQTHLQTIVNKQEALDQRLIRLETNATNQLNNLTHQFKNLRLTHTKEQKQIELHSNGSDFNKSRQYGNNAAEDQEY